MPTDLLPALKRRKAERQNEGANIIFVPLALCGFTVALAVASPNFAAAMALLAFA